MSFKRNYIKEERIYYQLKIAFTNENLINIIDYNLNSQITTNDIIIKKKLNKIITDFYK